MGWSQPGPNEVITTIAQLGDLNAYNEGVFEATNPAGVFLVGKLDKRLFVLQKAQPSSPKPV